MVSRIEQLIDEISEYIDRCKYSMFSKTDIIVNKEEIDDYLKELRARTPEEIKHYQKIIERKEAILDDARKKADDLINRAQAQTNELVSESEIMQQAYAQANEVVMTASEQAKDILNKATNEANALRESAIQYLDDMLGHLEQLLNGSLNTTNAHYDSFTSSIQSYLDVIHQNQLQLHPESTESVDAYADMPLPAQGHTGAGDAPQEGGQV